MRRCDVRTNVHVMRNTLLTCEAQPNCEHWHQEGRHQLQQSCEHTLQENTAGMFASDAAPVSTERTELYGRGVGANDSDTEHARR